LNLAFWKRAAPLEATADDLIADFYRSLSPSQRREVCLAWDFADEERGQVRGFIANHWQVTRPCVRSEFFGRAQQAALFDIYSALLAPGWRDRFLQALRDDTKGHPWGQDQSIAILGEPGAGPWHFLFTGRHTTLRAQGPGASDFAFGGPVVYGHAAQGNFWEGPGHRGNVFWPQAIAASQVHALLDPSLRALAEVDRLPEEYDIAFRSQPFGAPVVAFNPRARKAFERLLSLLAQPYRATDRQRLSACLQAQGGIDCLHLAFAREPRMSAPLWDVWRVQGPAFVWHFQGSPHVHGWVHVASTPHAGSIQSRHGAFIFPEHDELR
jgi:hypothetical protein